MALEFLGYGQRKEVYKHVQDWLADAKDEDVRPAQFMRADALDREGDYPNAIKDYQNLLEQEKDNPLVLFPLARLLLLSPGASAKDAEKAEGLLTSAMKFSGPRSHMMELRAVAKLHQGNIGGCIEDLRATLAEQPTATGYFLLAVALRKSNDKREAENTLEQSTRLGSKTFKLTEQELNLMGVKVLVNELKNKEFSREDFEKEITKILNREEITRILSPDEKKQLQSLILNYAGFNMSLLHLLEAAEYRRLCAEAYRGSP